MIFDETTLQKINHLSLVATRIRAGVMKGERRSSHRGSSLEFADYRDYAPGDDLRRLDWNVYARLDKPFIKLFLEEEDLSVQILLDTSQSMDWGDKDYNKFAYSCRLAAALGVIALSNNDHLTVTAVRGDKPAEQFGPTRNAGQIVRLFHFLEALPAVGSTNLNYALKIYAQAPHRPGLVFLISDLFSPTGFQDGLAALARLGCEITVVHVLSPDELNPVLDGDLRLKDVETEQTLELSLNSDMLSVYCQRLQGWQTELRSYCLARGMRYLPCSTGLPWEKLILQEMRKAGVVK